MFLRKGLKDIIIVENKDRCVSFIDLQMKIISLVCLLESRLKLIFHWKAHFFQVIINSFTEVFTSYTAENIDVSLAKSFVLEDKLSDKSLT